MSTLPELPESAVEAFEKAMEMIAGLAEMGDLEEREAESRVREVLDQLALAIVRAGGVFPVAQAFLAFFLVSLDCEKAFYHAQQALQYDLDALSEFLARVAYASCYGPVHGKKAYNRMQWFKGSSFVSFLGRTVTYQSFKSGLLAAYQRVLESYARVLREEDDVGTWVWVAHIMISLGDYVENNDFLRGKLDFYSPIIRAPWSKVAPEGDPRVQEVVDLAHARRMLSGR